MSKKGVLIFGVVLALLALAVLYLFKEDPNQENLDTYYSSNWENKYVIEEKGPRGISIFNELLEFRTKLTTSQIADTLKEKHLNDSTTYVFIGDKFQLKKEEFDSLVNRVERGSNLFLAYQEISNYIHLFLFSKNHYEWNFSQHLDVSYGKQRKWLRLSAVHQSDTVAKLWNFLDMKSARYGWLSKIDDVRPLSSVDGHCNMIEFDLGKGHIYVHSNPEVFQNYQLLSKNGYEYAQFMLQHIPKYHHVKWLELGRLDDSMNDGDGDKGGGKKDDSYLQFIFKNKALTIAFILSVLGLILYLIFRTKRSQPLVPYVAKSANHSLSFADTIKEIYFRKQTPFSILKVMRKNFTIAVNKQFFIDIGKEEKEKEIALLAEKSGVPLKRVQQIIEKFEIEEPSAVDYAYLHKISDLQQQFYRDTGIIKDKMIERVEGRAMEIKRKMWIPVALIFFGIFSIFYGFYLLFLAQGIGILLWPTGIVLLSFGIRQLVLPVLKVKEENITFYYLFRRKKKYRKDQLITITVDEGQTQFEMDDQAIHQIVHTDISQYDLHVFEQFVSTYLKEKL